MTESIWLFGYGSIIWRPDFPYLEDRPAYVEGWERRFWQGSQDHRGVKSDPGRVATLVRSPQMRCYGHGFRISHDVFEHLDHRESNGYERHNLTIYFLDQGGCVGQTYIAPTTNPAFLGDAPLDEMAAQISRCSGKSGTNVEYLLKLAEVLRKLNISDPHVFELERRVLAMQGF